MFKQIKSWLKFKIASHSEQYESCMCNIIHERKLLYWTLACIILFMYSIVIVKSNKKYNVSNRQCPIILTQYTVFDFISKFVKS